MPRAYEIPLFGTKADALHGWLLDAVAEGEIWLQSQRPTGEWQKIMEVLGPQYGGGLATLVGQSNTGYNLVRYDFSQIRATLSNFKHAGEFVPTEDDAQELFDRAHLLTNLDRHWERTTFPNLVIRDAVSLAAAKGTAYLYEDWDKGRWGPNRGDIRLRAVDPADVTFVQLPKTHDIQQAYVVLIREELPLQLAKRMYAWSPTFANGLLPDRDASRSGLVRRGFEKAQQWMSPALRTMGTRAGGKPDDSYPMVFIWHAYTVDGSINQNAMPVPMGALGTNWTYDVPALGDPIPQGILNPATGQEWTLSATPDDCVLFPLRRLTIFARTGIAYDGSSPWWHGATPLARLRFNDLPWEALGASQVGDAITIQDGIVALMQNIENSAACKLRPPMLIDERIDKAQGQAFDTGKAGSTMQVDLTLGSPFEFPFPPQYYDVPQWITGFIAEQENRINKITCAQDLIAIAKARQIPSADTLEKLMEMAGPGVQDMVGALVHPLTQLGEWRKGYYFQFYTRSRMLRIADPEGTEILTNVKYLPEKLVPYTKDETTRARAALARSYLGDFRYEITESGLSEINRMGQTLLYIQLKKGVNFPLSNYTLAKVARVPNYGPPPKGTNTEYERWLAEQRMDMELKIEFAEEMQRIQGEAAPPDASGGAEGRPPSFQKSPRLVNKPNEGRSTIATS